MELDFFTGHHGSGKTYTATKLQSEIGAELVDGGPTIRKAFIESDVDDFAEWARRQENESGVKWDDLLLLESIKSVISKVLEARKHLFVVGNRNIETIDFLKENVSDGEIDKILYFERPIEVMKRGYELRTGKTLTNDEFMQILRGDNDMGLSAVRQHVVAHPKTDALIKSNKYDHDAIEQARKAILKAVKKK